MIAFGWVITNELAGMGMPGMVAQLEDDLFALQENGVGAVVNLTEHVLDEGAFRRANLDMLHVPIPDMMPPSREEIDQVVGFVEAEIAGGKPVVIHCFAGRGRTGTMLACVLVRRGFDPLEAIQRIREVRPGSIETESQVAAVIDYAHYLKIEARESSSSVPLSTRIQKSLN